MSTQKSFLSLPLILITLGHLAVDLGQGAVPVLLPFIKELFFLSYTEVGIIVMVQNFTSSVIQPLFGYAIDKVYWPFLLPLSIFIAALGMSLTGFAPSYYGLLIIVVIAGLGSASFHPQGAVAINHISKFGSRGKSMGLFSVGGNLGFALGSLFMVFLLAKIPGGLTNTIYFAIPGIIVSALIIVHLKELSPAIKKEKTTANEAEITTKKIPWRMLTILLAFIFVRSTIHTSLQTYIPLYYINYLKEDPVYASYLVSLFLLGGACGTFVGASMSDKYGRKLVIVTSMLLSLPLLLIFPYVPTIPALLLIFLSGGALVSSFATTLILAQEMMPGNIGVASGLTVGFSLGLGGIGTTILGMVADRFDLPTVLFILGVLPVFGLLLALQLPGQKSRT